MIEMGDSGLELLIKFCDFCLKKEQQILLYIYKEGENFFQKIKAVSYDITKEFIILEATNNEAYLIQLGQNNIFLRTKEIVSKKYPIFPRETLWGKKILFEIIDSIHNKEIIYALGSENENTITEFVKQYELN